MILSAGLGLLLYVLSALTSNYRNIHSRENIVLLVVSLLLLIIFPFWMHFQVTRNKPALIPNRLWLKGAFTSSCLAVFFCWASLNGIEYFTTL